MDIWIPGPEIIGNLGLYLCNLRKWIIQIFIAVFVLSTAWLTSFFLAVIIF